MMYLARLGAIAILVWFYLTAKEKGEPAIKWAIIGFIGYWLTWFIVDLTAVPALAKIVPKTITSIFIVGQIPALCSLAAAFFIRKKLLSDIPNQPTQLNN